MQPSDACTQVAAAETRLASLTVMR